MATLPVRRRDGMTQQRQQWDPFHELQQFHNQLGALMGGSWPGNGGDSPWLPAVDIEETEDAWIVEAELPGVDKADINVETRDSELVVFGDIKEKERKGILRRRERKTGQFEVRMTLPGPAESDKIDAKLKDGVLTVRVPKPEVARPRKIEVGSA
jgi:HSP20 family protein